MSPIVNQDTRTVVVDGETKQLTPKEMGILKLLMEHEGKAFTPQEIYERVWQSRPYDCEKIVAVHLRHIREKIEDDPSHPTMIRSYWGRGYQYM